MKNTFAIGIPDKVSAAERDKFFDDLAKAVKVVGKSKLKLWEKQKSKVIEFDLPKGYSADDAYCNGLYWLSISEFWGSISRASKAWNYITKAELVDHFNEPEIDYSDLDSLFLLLAAANGHKLE